MDTYQPAPTPPKRGITGAELSWAGGCAREPPARKNNYGEVVAVTKLLITYVANA